MNVERTKIVLKSLHIPDDWCRFEPEYDLDEATVLLFQDHEWVVYGMNRGHMNVIAKIKSESDACIYLIEGAYHAYSSNTKSTALTTRSYNSNAPFHFDVDYETEWVLQFGVDPNLFDLTGRVSNGKFVVNRENDGWAVWLEDKGVRKHEAWFRSGHEMSRYILAMLLPRPWKDEPT